jgi:cytochrome P450
MFVENSRFPCILRRANPGNDILSQMIHDKIDGRPLTDVEAVGLVAPMLNKHYIKTS